MTAMYSAQVRTVGESMARSMTDVHAFKIFMDEAGIARRQERCALAT